jgi:hypothetical protein
MSQVVCKISLLAAIFVFALSLSAVAQVDLSTACEPYGSVMIQGQPAANNLIVIAYVGDIELARTHTANGQYALFIPKDNPDTPQREGYRDGEIISIRVNGNQTLPSFEAFSGRQRRDLEVSALSVRQDTWGRIKALFR